MVKKEQIRNVFKKFSGRPWVKIARSTGAVVLALGLFVAQVSLAGCADQTIQQGNSNNSYYEGRHGKGHDRLPPGSSSNAAAENNPPVPGNSNGGTANPGQTKKDAGISGDNSGSGSDISTGTSSGSSEAKVSLAQYLGGMFCNGCDKNCCLLNPGCEKGASKQAAAKQQYQTLYGTSAAQ